MKRNFISLILFVVLVFSSCGIDEPQIKPDYTLAGKQMFDKVESHIRMVTDWLDIVLKMNTYIQSDEANRIKIEDKYFPEYKVRNSSANTWVLIQNSDTICKVIVDGNPFTSLGAKWKLQKDDMVLPCVFTCVSANNWSLQVSDFAINKNYVEDDFYSNSTSIERYMSDSLNFACESALPENFESYNFQVSGKGLFLLTNSIQEVKMWYNIDQKLIHKANSLFNMNSGKYTLGAEDLETSESGTANADFETIIGDNMKITIKYKGRTQTYPINRNLDSIPY